jgi:hypothetical protein
VGLVVSCGRTDGQADVSKLVVATRSFANAPNEQNARRLDAIYRYPWKTFHVNVEVAAWTASVVKSGKKLIMLPKHTTGGKFCCV